MDRKKFIELVGVGSAAIAIATCLGACKKDSTSTTTTTPTPTPTPGSSLFDLDLNDSANAALGTPGGYVYKNGVIVARAVSGSYIAVSQTCTHAQFTLVYRTSPQSEFHCTNHGSNFAENGTVLNGPAASPLTQYKTSLNGNILSVKSS